MDIGDLTSGLAAVILILKHGGKNLGMLVLRKLIRFLTIQVNQNLSQTEVAELNAV